MKSSACSLPSFASSVIFQAPVQERHMKAGEGPGGAPMSIVVKEEQIIFAVIIMLPVEGIVFPHFSGAVP